MSEVARAEEKGNKCGGIATEIEDFLKKKIKGKGDFLLVFSPNEELKTENKKGVGTLVYMGLDNNAEKMEKELGRVYGSIAGEEGFTMTKTRYRDGVLSELLTRAILRYTDNNEAFATSFVQALAASIEFGFVENPNIEYARKRLKLEEALFNLRLHLFNGFENLDNATELLNNVVETIETFSDIHKKAEEKVDGKNLREEKK